MTTALVPLASTDCRMSQRPPHAPAGRPRATSPRVPPNGRGPCRSRRPPRCRSSWGSADGLARGLELDDVGPPRGRRLCRRTGKVTASAGSASSLPLSARRATRTAAVGEIRRCPRSSARRQPDRGARDLAHLVAGHVGAQVGPEDAEAADRPDEAQLAHEAVDWRPSGPPVGHEPQAAVSPDAQSRGRPLDRGPGEPRAEVPGGCRPGPP